jgi:hypothetical protein
MTITMARKQTTSRIICMLLLPVLTLLFTSGCATNLSKPAHAPEPAKVRLDEFENVEMKAVGIAEKFASAPANQKALKKIDEILFSDMRMVFPNCKRIEQGDDFSRTTKRTLQITPYIKEIKFIGGGARFWVGSMAGSSAVLMQATLRDSSNGEIIADPEFYRDAGARAGGWTMGATDNRMLEEIAQDVVKYCSYNR